MCKRSVIFVFLIVSGLALAAAATAQAPPGGLAVRFDNPDLWRFARGVGIGGALRLEAVPLGGEGPRALDLARFEVFAPEARVTVHGDAGTTTLPAPDNAYFRGTIEGDTGSLALLTARSGGGLRGLVTRGGSFWVMDSGPGVLMLRRVDAETELAGETAGFRCAADELEEGEGLDRTAATPPPPAAPPAADKDISYTARVAIETDWEFFQLFGNAADAADYAGDLIAYGSSVYAGEVATSLLVVSLNLWSTSADPWSQSPGLCGLFEFGRYWNDHRGDVERTLAHFLSGKSANSGIAWVGVLCRGAFNASHDGSCPALVPTVDNYGGAYGYSGGLDGDFDLNDPTVLWDIYVVAHEIGHNFNSPHTHCYENLGGNPAPVDECYAGQCGQTGCYCGAPSLPCAQPGAGCGTLMSYCHLQSGGLANISFTFGAGHPWGVEPERVPSRMNAHAMAQAAVNPGCLDPVAGADPIFSDGFESGDTSAWSATSG